MLQCLPNVQALATHASKFHLSAACIPTLMFTPPYMQVWVREPEKQDGVNRLGLRSSHYTYCVRTEATLPSLRAEGTEVRRRFSEFDVSNSPNYPPKNDGNCESLVGLDAISVQTRSHYVIQCMQAWVAACTMESVSCAADFQR